MKALQHIRTAKQVAEGLGLAVNTVRDLCADGKLQCTKLGREWLIDEAEIERYRHERKPIGRPRKARRMAGQEQGEQE